MRFKTHENLPGDIVSALRADGHDVSSVRNQGMSGHPDEAVAQVCTAEGRVVFSLDLDFADVRRFPPHQHAGVIVLRPSRQDPVPVMRLFELVRGRLRSADIRGQLWIVGESGLRIRRNPPA